MELLTKEDTRDEQLSKIFCSLQFFYPKPLAYIRESICEAQKFDSLRAIVSHL